MEQLAKIAQCALERSEDALVRLEKCVGKQRRLYESERSDQCLSEDSSSTIVQYYSYLGQLNCLYIKAQSLKDMMGNRCGHLPNSTREAIERLEHDYKALCNLANELGIREKNLEDSPSCLSPASVSSFQPKPLKIIERRLAQTNISPTKVCTTTVMAKSFCRSGTDKNSDYIPDEVGKPNSCDTNSPCTNEAKKEPKFIRAVKSCGTGLNKHSNPHENRLSFFRDRQRLSISFIEDDEYLSDEETITSGSPLNASFLLNDFAKVAKERPNQTLGSSRHVENNERGAQTAAVSPFVSLVPKKTCAAQIGLTSIDIRPDFGPCSSPKKFETTESKEILSHFVIKEPRTKSHSWLKGCDKSVPFLQTFKIFNNQVLVTSETGCRNVDRTTSTKLITRSRKHFAQREVSDRTCSILVHGSSGSKFVNAPQQQELHFKVSYEALREALNTDLNN